MHSEMLWIIGGGLVWFAAVKSLIWFLHSKQQERLSLWLAARIEKWMARHHG